ncbi:MAG: UDP-2,3-diacylglucosamine diphosphatase LpxI, partial [bacterium]
LLLIAGNGSYPLELAAAAKARGVRRLCVIAMRGETSRAIGRLADEIHWLPLGKLQLLLDTARRTGIAHAVMAGQISPTAVFRLAFMMDQRLRALVARLPAMNAHTVFPAIAGELRGVGVELLPAYLFMESKMPAPGTLTARAPTAAQSADIQLGLRTAKLTGSLEIGQTVVVKNGAILAVEAFEGTDAAIRRAGKLGGAGAVVVKVAKRGHDMRFDIPVVGLRTLRALRRAGIGALAIEAGRTIMLERETFLRRADRAGICVVAMETEELS